MAADSRVVGVARRGGGGQAGVAHYRYCYNKPSNNSDKYEREAGVTNVSLSYDYLARLLLAGSFVAALQNDLLPFLRVYVSESPPFFLLCFLLSRIYRRERRREPSFLFYKEISITSSCFENVHTWENVCFTFYNIEKITINWKLNVY